MDNKNNDQTKVIKKRNELAHTSYIKRKTSFCCRDNVRLITLAALEILW